MFDERGQHREIEARYHLGTMTPLHGSLAPFLDPASVAVIGASRDPFKVGGAVVANLRSAGFPGRIVPVNSRASTVQGLPSAPRDGST